MKMTPEQGRQEGEARKLVGMELAALRKEHDIKRAKLAMLNAAMARDERTYSANDIPDDLTAQYAGGGAWVGAAVYSLARSEFVEKAGYIVSTRPSRHSGILALWHVLDEEWANLTREDYRLWLANNPIPVGETQLELSTARGGGSEEPV